MTSSLAQELASLLRENSIDGILTPSRIGASAQYDVLYRFAMIGCTIEVLGKQDISHGSYTINAGLLTIAQFIATRPSTVSSFEHWIRSQKKEMQTSLADWPVLPRGFITDSPHRAAVQFLICQQTLKRIKSDFLEYTPGTRNDLLGHILSEVKALHLFLTERQALSALRKMTLNLSIFGLR